MAVRNHLRAFAPSRETVSSGLFLHFHFFNRKSQIKNDLVPPRFPIPIQFSRPHSIKKIIHHQAHGTLDNIFFSAAFCPCEPAFTQCLKVFHEFS
jgi:hypothetical protein